MREYHLFAGCGGGILGGLLNGFIPVGACEIEPYNQTLLRNRQSEGFLPAFPIVSDIRELSGESLRGTFDVLCGGFPCQAFSSAARGRNLESRDLWREMLRVVQESNAPMVFAENVSEKAINRAEEDIKSLGYRTATCRLGGADLGAPHRRDRYWLCAYADNQSELLCTVHAKTRLLPKLCPGVWQTHPKQSGVVDEFSHRVDRFRATGNGQIPVVAAIAFRVLIARLFTESTQISPDTESTIPEPDPFLG